MAKLRAFLTLSVALSVLSLVGYSLYNRYVFVAASYAFVRGTVVEVGSPFEAKVATVTVHPGQRVNAGDVLVRLDDTRQRMAQARARASWEYANANINVEREELRAQYKKAESLMAQLTATVRVQQSDARVADIQAELAKLQAERATRLRELGSSSQSDTEIALAGSEDASQKVQRAADRVALARSSVQRVDVEQAQIGVRRARLALLEANAAVALAAVRSSDADVDMMVIRAPQAGVVSRMLVGEGSAVRAGGSLLEVWYDDSVSIEAWIDEAHYGSLAVGSPAQVTLSGLSERKFHGRVRWLGVVTDSELKAASFSLPVAKVLARSRWVRTEIQLDQPDPRLLPGLTVDVIIPRMHWGQAARSPNERPIVTSPPLGAKFLGDIWNVILPDRT